MIRSLFLSLCLLLSLKSIAQKETNTKSKGFNIQEALNQSYEFHLNGDFKASFELTMKALEYAKKTKDTINIIKSYSYLGDDYLIQGEIETAKDIFLKAKYLSEKINDSISLADSYCNLGTVYGYDKKQLSQAYVLFEKALKIYNALDESDGVIFGYMNFTSTALAQKDFKKIQQLLPIMQNPSLFEGEYEEEFRLLVNLTTARYYSELKDYNNALKYYRLAFNNPESLQYKSMLDESYQEYALSLYKLGYKDEAFDIQNKYIEAYKKGEQERNSLSVRKLDAKFKLNEYTNEMSKLKLERSLAEQKNSSNNKTNYFLSGLLVLALSSFIILYIATRRRKALIEALKIRNQKYLLEKQKSDRLSKVKSNFFSTVSHELRTPLYGVIGLSNILLEKHKDKKIAEDLQSLKFSADHLLTLINNVLLINKLEHSSGRDKISFDLENMIQKITNSFEFMRLENKNLIQYHIHKNVPKTVSGHYNSLSQILMNLLSNANKFTVNGTITVEIEKVETFKKYVDLKFSVIDTGKGIEKDKINHIFDEFEQINESDNNEYQGTGLGLSIVRKLLHLNNSEITVTSEVNKGSVFSFILRMGTKNLNRARITDDSKNIARQFNELKGKKILITEDNKINQVVTRKILEQDGLICEIADNGKIAVEMAKNNEYDLILMDINMPVMNGYDASAAIREFSIVPIIALTAGDLGETTKKIKQYGINDVIIKPYDVELFKNKILNQFPELAL